MRKTTTISIIIAILTLSLIAVIVISYKGKQEKVIETERSTVTKSNLMAAWKTYTNEEYGYKIKYPNELICNDSNKKHVTWGSKVMPYFSVDVYNNPNNLSLKEFVSQLLKDGFGSLLDLSSTIWRVITIGGINGLQVSFENVVGGYSGKVSWDYVQKGEKVYRIALYQDFGQWSYSELHNILIFSFIFSIHSH